MKTRRVGLIRVEDLEESSKTGEYSVCPVCSSLGSVGEIIEIKSHREGRGVTPWDAGGYFCLRCGLKAPKYAWACLTSLVTEKE